ncbi:molybdenum cofactor guanylyltransferase [Sporosarcina aquimarina]|uniref:Probable molybdenum cofactor guanylyltransferase n=1 Tax=Sporosarcina aquimarina TaxID=114975 RepID=A0ABU4FV41_9BACL|nr:molybdenum cofactor guanylyltransferase [Sporosarcina aquimarina]MDW0108536.1 molybdenum cofactor guanylyltransferase [Sporosarcina aquimarina]
MIGIVLAGGQSRRYGSPKAFAKFRGKYFYEYAMDALASHCSEIIIIARPEDVDRFPDAVTVVTDILEFAGQGPLAGILTGMCTIKSDWYAVLPCDVPFADGLIIQKLVNHRAGFTSVAIEEAGKLHPLLSLWSKEAEFEIRSLLEQEKRSVRPLIEKWVDGSDLLKETPNLFENVNRPGQLEGR